jgi:hypothetical protein
MSSLGRGHIGPRGDGHRLSVVRPSASLSARPQIDAEALTKRDAPCTQSQTTWSAHRASLDMSSGQRSCHMGCALRLNSLQLALSPIAQLASPTGEVACSTVASSCVITRCVTTLGDPDLGGDCGCGGGVIAQGVGDDGCWRV